MVIRQIKDRAAKSAKPVKLMALKGAPSNAFYSSLGFELTHQEEFDNHYIWDPARG